MVRMNRRRKRRIEWDGDRIRALRSHLQLSQQELSEELGTRQQTISEWETGIYRPRGVSVTLLSIVAERSGFRYRANRKKAPSQES
ncbi:MAG: helix-turn-helix domain-containing protein [Dehalococcoidia bacterium]|nr:helix-turn-helix domain-containing protein [Dehalococcoidia bacterium]